MGFREVERAPRMSHLPFPGADNQLPPIAPADYLFPEDIAEPHCGVAAEESCDYTPRDYAMGAPKRGQQHAGCGNTTEHEATAKPDLLLQAIGWFHDECFLVSSRYRRVGSLSAISEHCQGLVHTVVGDEQLDARRAAFHA